MQAGSKGKERTGALVGNDWRFFDERQCFAYHLDKTHAGTKLNRISCVLRDIGYDHGEFDPGSERTLAARLKHASRAGDSSLLLLRAADW